MSTKKLSPLAGSERSPLRGAREIGPANPNEQVEVTIRLRSRAGKKPIVGTENFRLQPGRRQVLSREQFESMHGADPADITRIEAFAKDHNLKVVEKSPGRRTVILSGTVAAVSDAFGVQLKQYEHPSGRYRGRVGAVQLSPELHDVVTGVFGLDNRPQAKPHFRRRQGKPGAHAQVAQLSYNPPQVASLYNFPTNVDGTGETIAIIELGGGFSRNDLNNYFSQLNLPKAPNVTAIPVGNGNNNPTGDPNGPDGEVLLDIEVAGSIAPGTNIVVYFAENTDAGFLNAITTAVHDKTNNPSIISISWGGPESSWTSQAMTNMDEAFQAAAALGVTVCVASGDNGSDDGVGDGQNHVDFPASSPFALGCGGTHLVASGNTITSETVWNELPNAGATGGGFSSFFQEPDYQTSANINTQGNTGRGVPDVSGDADPTSGYNVLVDGQPSVIGGTSAVAPLWAALLALVNQTLGKPAGYINPLLYQNGPADGAFTDITTGNNGAFSAGPGWDPCTGLGSPVGTGIAVALGAPAAAASARTGTSRR